MLWLAEERSLVFDDYDSLWEWSVNDLRAFWGSLAQFLEIPFATQADNVLEDDTMPATGWFDGATLNYAKMALAGDAGDAVLLAMSQTRPATSMSRSELRTLVGQIRAGLIEFGVGRGDRVAAYLPNIPETLALFLATASLGAVWVCCPPEFEERAVLDRLGQVEPSLLVAVDGYRFGDKSIERLATVEQLHTALGDVPTIVVPYLTPGRGVPHWCVSWPRFVDRAPDLNCDSLPFAHPLHILFSSGTTGRPKAIVHGHGGVMLEHLKWLHLHFDVGVGDRLFFYSTTGWMTWNASVSALLTGASLVLYDGDPLTPDVDSIWRLVEATRATHVGLGAPLLMRYRAASAPNRAIDVSSMRSLMSSGAHFSAEGFTWVHERFGVNIQFASVSGGTDVCSAFLGMNPLVPVFAGEMSRPFLGARVESWDEKGRSVNLEEGELVLTTPLPSMPLGFWNDPDGENYRKAYFARYSGVWAHGDRLRITERGTYVISGRSDATLNRGGVRLGTGEFYSVIDEVDEVVDSLVIHLDGGDRPMGELVLFVALAPGVPLDEQLVGTLQETLRKNLSPRHVPDRIVSVPGIPRTMTGKRMEVPVKRLLAGTLNDQAKAFAGLADVSVLAAFENYARPSGHIPARD